MSKSVLKRVVLAHLALAVVLGASFAGGERHEPGFRIDHFKVYRVDSVEAGPMVKLRGQFDRLPKPARLVKLTHFANPVSKNGERIRNPIAHLNFYVIEQRAAEPKRGVDITNQFGKYRLRLGDARFLLAPAEKRERGSGAPYGLDHYKCYAVIEGRPIEKVVTLKDQFTDDRAAVGRPVIFCVPVQKYYREGWEQLKNRRDHLTFYEIEPSEHEKGIWSIDQFGQRELKVMRRELLGVPTLKKVPEEPRCVRFEQLPLGAVYHVGDTFVDSGVTMEAKQFQWGSGGWTAGGFAEVENRVLAGGSGQELQVNNINIDFDFGGRIGGVVLKFGEYGGNLNLDVNGSFQNFEDFADIHGAVIGGATASVVNGHGNDKGTLLLSGNITDFAVGGQELWIDDVCPVDEP